MLASLPLLPDGTTLPPIPYLVGVLGAALAVGVALRRRRPRVTQRHVIALAPWMVLGSVLHVLYVIEALPALLAPLAGSPTVYLTVGAIAGGTWLGALAVSDRTRSPGTAQTAGSPSDGEVSRLLAVGGALLVAPVVAVAATTGVSVNGVVWSLFALVATVPVTAVVWVGLTRLVPTVSVTGGVGVLAVFGHALDGLSTAVGVTQLGFGERTPISRAILELGGIPSLPIVGEGWLFLLVKLALASAIVWLFADYVRDTPGEGYLLVGFIAAVGLGPAAHNLLLFSVVG